MHFAAWPGIALILAMFGLVVVVHQVVRGAVEQGEMRRKAIAARSEAEWRCKALNGRGVTVESLLRLNSAPPTVAERDVERRT
jgi:hypothetical protein